MKLTELLSEHKLRVSHDGVSWCLETRHRSYALLSKGNVVKSSSLLGLVEMIRGKTIDCSGFKFKVDAELSMDLVLSGH